MRCGPGGLGSRKRARQTTDLDEVTSLITERSRKAMGEKVTEEAIERMDQTTSYSMNTSGYMRYFDKKAK